jgi:hypothetical protein
VFCFTYLQSEMTIQIHTLKLIFFGHKEEKREISRAIQNSSEIQQEGGKNGSFPHEVSVKTLTSPPPSSQHRRYNYLFIKSTSCQEKKKGMFQSFGWEGRKPLLQYFFNSAMSFIHENVVSLYDFAHDPF